MDPFKANQSPVATDNRILGEYPQPLARAWERVLIASPRPEFHHRQLLVMAETITCYLAALALQSYEAYLATGGQPDPALNRSLRALRRPTFGQWLGWVRMALAAVPAEESVLPELAPAYEQDDTGMVLLGYESLRPIMVVQMGYTGEYGPRTEVSPRLLLELINQYQLRRARHPDELRSGFDELAVASSLAPGLRAVLGYLSFLADYPLLGLVRDPEGQVHVLKLMGLDATESEVEFDPTAAPPGTLLLADRDELPQLVLDPWLIYTTCPADGRVQIAAFEHSEGNSYTYRGLDCEHAWTVEHQPDAAPDLPEVELSAIEPQAEGEIPPEMAAAVPTELGDYERDLFAALEYEADRLQQERALIRQQRAAAAAAHAEAALTPPQTTDPDAIYRELLETRAVGGLTLDELQALDEARAAEEYRKEEDQQK